MFASKFLEMPEEYGALGGSGAYKAAICLRTALYIG
jgi:hypothetical protein